jgi:threonine dehydrogenase-like Zn-dependent dehydrogenase
MVYQGAGSQAWKEVPDPVIAQPTDVIVRVDTTTICGTDLHILKGDVPAVTEGRILGHEGVGTVAEVGSAVSTVAVGDRVIISCISACGLCSYCHQGLYAHCLAEEVGERDRLDPRPPDRRHAGRARPGALRRQLPVQGSRGRDQGTQGGGYPVTTSGTTQHLHRGKELTT